MPPMSRKRSRSAPPRGPVPVPRMAPWFGYPRGFVPRGWVMRRFSLGQVHGPARWFMLVMAIPLALIFLAALVAALSSLVH